MIKCNRLLKRTYLFLVVFIQACCCTMSCDSVIYDYEGDCSTDYRVELLYDKNMKWADAFGSEVGSVNLYAFDQNDILVWQKSERYDGATAGGHFIELDLLPGDYRLVAWGGLSGGLSDTFVLTETEVGKTRMEDLHCSLVRTRDESRNAVSGNNLTPLFHAIAAFSLPQNEDGDDFVFTLGLTKNTNHVRVILQQLSGDDVNVDDFEFVIEEENGLMGPDNGLLDDELIRYIPYHTDSGTASMTNDDYPVMGYSSANVCSNVCSNVSTIASTNAITNATAFNDKQIADSQPVTSISVAIADFSVGRLMDGMKTYLTIKTVEDGQIAARIPLVDYALLLKQGYGKEIDSQEYLDRQDEYALTFFLDGRNKWIGTSIIINSWKFVLNDVDFN